MTDDHCGLLAPSSAHCTRGPATAAQHSTRHTQPVNTYRVSALVPNLGVKYPNWVIEPSDFGNGLFFFY